MTRLLIAALLASAAAPALAEETAPRVAITYHVSELSSPEGARRVYGRLKSAARAVCRDGSVGLSSADAEDRCRREALDRAVRDLNRPEIAALHNRDRVTLAGF